jgi:RecA/RadA recombinase
MSILDKIRKNSTIKEADLLIDSEVFNKKDLTSTKIPMLNVALSGFLDGGLYSGITTVAGASKHFKTGFCLVLVDAYLRKNPDAACLYYDSEFGSPPEYWESFVGENMKRVFHTPITDVEKLKFDIVSQLEGIERGDKVIIIVDSLGMLASKKEAEDAVEQKSVADMSRAKAITSFYRIITPHIKMKDIPAVIIGHTYKETGLYPKEILGGGDKAYLASDAVWFIGRQQDKDTEGLHGYNFIIKVDKSRYVKEGSKIPINVGFDYGINIYSGLLEMALETGFVTKPSNGWYQKKDDTKKVREDNTNTAEFWDSLLKDKNFQEAVNKIYKL